MHTLKARPVGRPPVPSPARPDHPDRRARGALARAVAVVAIVGLLGAACGGDDEPAASSGDPSVGSAADIANIVKPVAGDPKPGGTLIVGLDAESEGFNPTDNRMAVAALTVSRAVFDPLVLIGDDFQPKPYLAESLTPSNEARTWDIKLRSGITFHDGTPLDSAALKKSLDAFRASARVGTAAKPIQSIDVVDDLTVRLQMDQKWATFPLFLSAQPGYVAAPSMLDGPDGSRNPVGTGPFRFKSWETDKSLVVEKNPSYWRKGLPYLDSVDFRPISDNQTRYKALQAGSVDVIITPREQTIQDLVKDGRAGTFQVVRARGDNDVNMLMLNVSKPPFDDIRLRQAVANAVDRDQLLALTNSGQEIAAYGVYAKSSPWYADVGYPARDPERARRLVAGIEAEKGPIRITLDTVPDQDVQRQVTLAQAVLQEVGIEVEVKTTEQANLINKAISGDYEVMTWRQFGAVDPDFNYVWWHSDYATGAVALNMPRNADPEIDQALIQGRESTDPEIRKKAYAKVQERQAKDLPYIWLTHMRWTMGAANKVHNIEAGTLPDGSRAAGLIGGTMMFTEFWIDH